jgi:predicted RNase H-like HicB family nuclease
VKTLLFRVVIEPDGDRWVAYCPALAERGAASWGHTAEEALQNLHPIVQMTIDSMRAHGEPIPEEP